jgi:parallel beta-helix repeat protein
MSKNIVSIFGLICLLILCVANIKYGNSQPLDVYLTDASNQVINGALRVTLVNCTNITVTNAHGKILLVDSNYSRIFGNSITGVFGDPNNVHYEACIVLFRSNHNDIFENNLSNSDRGVLVYADDPYSGKFGESRYNNIYGNNISNTSAGIYCLTGCSNTAIYANIITHCNGGIVLRYSNQNEIFKNSIKDCRTAISLSGAADNNAFYNNNFLSTYVYENHESLPNLLNMYSVNNTWDAGYPKGGNYWSNYNGTDKDGDGIGDTPFLVYENFMDRYPLMALFDISSSWDAPTVLVVCPENKTYVGTSVALNFTVSKSVSWIGYSLDGQENVTVTGNTTLIGLSVGAYNLTVYATDEAENTGASKTIHFTIAKEPEPFPTTLLVATASASVAVVSVGLLVYFRKRKR